MKPVRMYCIYEGVVIISHILVANLTHTKFPSKCIKESTKETFLVNFMALAWGLFPKCTVRTTMQVREHDCVIVFSVPKSAYLQYTEGGREEIKNEHLCLDDSIWICSSSKHMNFCHANNTKKRFPYVTCLSLWITVFPLVSKAN